MITVQIKKDYHGLCMCGKEAKHKEFMEFKDVQPYPPEFAEMMRAAGLPDEPPKGCYHYVCDDCVKELLNHD